MTDAITKAIGILLAFVLLILAPMTIARLRDDMATRRLVLNEVTMFIDKVTDKASVTVADMDDLLIGINAHGGAFDVQVVRYVRIAVRDATRGGEVRSIYYAADDVFTLTNGEVRLNLGDAIQVRVGGITKTKGQNLLQGLLRVSEQPFSFTLAGTVR
jgi:di/tricarboxylate transporter